MGTRAHTNADSASTAPVKRSALGPPGRPAGDKHPLPALDHNQLVRNRPTTRTTFDFHPGDLTRPDCTDKRKPASGPSPRSKRSSARTTAVEVRHGTTRPLLLPYAYSGRAGAVAALLGDQ